MAAESPTGCAAGGAPTLVFFPGYASDMEGAKALALDSFAERRGIGNAAPRLFGHRFEPRAISRTARWSKWLEESLAAVDRLTEGPLILIGSSMGGWIALHLALRRPERVQALVGHRGCARLHRLGAASAATAASAAAFRESGQRLLLLGGEIAVDCPVRLVHGEADDDVPLDIAFRTMRALRSADVQLAVIKGGGHRLSEPHEIDAILRMSPACWSPPE